MRKRILLLIVITTLFVASGFSFNLFGDSCCRPYKMVEPICNYVPVVCVQPNPCNPCNPCYTCNPCVPVNPCNPCYTCNPCNPCQAQCVLYPFYSHDFSQSFDGWNFIRHGSNNFWKREVISGETYLHLSQAGNYSMSSEKMIEIPCNLRGKCIVVRAVLMADVNYYGCNYSKEYAAAGMYAGIYNSNLGNFKDKQPDYGKAYMWTTSQYPSQYAPYRFKNEVFRKIDYCERMPVYITMYFSETETRCAQFLKVGFTAYAEGRMECATSDLWVSDVEIFVMN